MLAAVTYCNDPFRPSRKTEVKLIRRKRRINTLAPKTKLPFICMINGVPVLRANKGWNRTVKDGDVVLFITRMQGGGGGSNPLKIILAITIAIIAPQIGMAIAQGLGGMGVVGAGGIFGSTALLGDFIGAAVGFALNAVVNALIPAPSAPSTHRAASMAAPSPTYNLEAQGNRARFGQVLPVLYGRHVVYPDFAAQPYAEYAGNEQYLYQLLLISQGEVSIEELRLEDSVIESTVIADGAIHAASGNFEEIEYQVCYNQAVTLYPTNVSSSIEVAGQEANSVQGTYSQTGTTMTVTLTAHGLTTSDFVYLDVTTGTGDDGVYAVASTPTADTFTVTSASSETTSGNVSVGEFIGPFVANAAGTTCDALAVDVVLTKGLYYANSSGGLDTRSVAFITQARTINDSGTPTGSWTTLGSESLTLATTTPYRSSYRYAVASARYEVRFARTTKKDTDIRVGNDVVWGGLRAYLPGSQDYGSATVIAMKMRASNQLSLQASRRINMVATRKLPIWNGTSWSGNTATRNPAWAIADICKASYGMGIDDTRIDPDALLALANVWASRNDYFDGVFDNEMTAWEALSLVARAGRAMPYLQGGVVNVARDSAQTTPVAMFTTRNIVKGSFKIQYLLPNEETADAIDIDYFDSSVWQPKQVRAALPGSSEAAVAVMSLFGVSNRDQAWREGMYAAAANRYRRRIVTIATEMEGFIPSVTDLIAIQHDVPQWGVSGEVVAFDDVDTLTLSEDLTFGTGTHYIAFRKRDGSVEGPFSVTAGSAANEVVLDAALDPSVIIDTGLTRERTHFAFGLADELYLEARVMSIRPRSMERVEIVAVAESDFVHTADTGATPGATAWQLETRYTAPIIAGLFARSDPDVAENMFVGWQPAPGADHYLIEVSDSGNGWTRIGETGVANFTAIAPYGARTQIRVCAVGLVKGPWVEISYGLSASYMWSGVDSNLMWNADPATLMWSY